jgi:L-amino acid N-acyltransferase YncA
MQSGILRMSDITVRATRPEDVPDLTTLLNDIVHAGGTTAIETPLTEAELSEWFVTGTPVVSCVMAEQGRSAHGFQMISTYDPMPGGWASIGTYVRIGATGGGIGSALFRRTCANARAAGLTTLKATIRCDNTGGLAYYARIGFRDYDTSPGFALADGRIVGQVHRRFDL